MHGAVTWSLWKVNSSEEAGEDDQNFKYYWAMYLLTLNRGLKSTHQLRRPGSRQESSSWEKGTPNAQRECGNPSFPFLFFFLFLPPPFLSSSLSSLFLCSSPQILQSHIITSAHTIREGTLPLPSVEPQIPEARTKPHCFLSSPVLSLLGDT